ncbi:MAG TPA: PD-(D/E)XK nuclease family protein, partial [Ktedonobacteraceae bacterium]
MVPRFHTSVTERGAFRSCRRRWYYETHENLVHKTKVPWALIFGDAIHKGLEFYYKDERSVNTAIDAFKSRWDEEYDALYDVYGGL